MGHAFVYEAVANVVAGERRGRGSGCNFGFHELAFG
jgi:hypothetical protein